MSFWNIFGQMAVSEDGITIQKLSDTFSVSSDRVLTPPWVTSLLALMVRPLPRWAYSVAMAAHASVTQQRDWDLSNF